MPILLVGVFDKDVKAETALECHKLYAIGRLSMDLNIKVRLALFTNLNAAANYCLLMT